MDKIIELLNNKYRGLVTHTSASGIYNEILEIVMEHRKSSEKCPIICECTCCKFHSEANEKRSNIDELRFLISDTILTYRRRNNV